MDAINNVVVDATHGTTSFCLELRIANVGITGGLAHLLNGNNSVFIILFLEYAYTVDVIGKSCAADYAMRCLSYGRREPAMKHSIPIGTLLNESEGQMERMGKLSWRMQSVHLILKGGQYEKL